MSTIGLAPSSNATGALRRAPVVMMVTPALARRAGAWATTWTATRRVAEGTQRRTRRIAQTCDARAGFRYSRLLLQLRQVDLHGPGDQLVEDLHVHVFEFLDVESAAAKFVLAELLGE